MRSLWYTAFAILSLLFLVLSYLEWQVPGFVSTVFPISIVFVLALGCGVATLVVGRKPRPRDRRVEMVAAGCGLLFAVLVFRAGDVFGAYRIVIALVTLVLPSLLLKVLSDVKE